MTDQTLTAMYDTRDEADEAQRQLVGLGYPERRDLDPWWRDRHRG